MSPPRLTVPQRDLLEAINGKPFGRWWADHGRACYIGNRKRDGKEINYNPCVGKRLVALKLLAFTFEYDAGGLGYGKEYIEITDAGRAVLNMPAEGQGVDK